MNVFGLLTPKKGTYYLIKNNTIRQALEKFDAHKFSVVPVLNEDGDYITSLSEGDILRYIKNVCNFDIKIAEQTCIMDIEKYRPYKELNCNGTEDEMYNLILSQNFIPIVDDRNKFIGIIKRKDVLLALKK